ncbi:MAG: hypothetical protein GVY16_03525 [Planctomycetes bacterium]|jgi:hypothetical protein|nr:hypothetical protein [Phycisphaerae bacterium]NBB94789.1 hypothetical protein [Planctomycetota bacterium]
MFQKIFQRGVLLALALIGVGLLIAGHAAAPAEERTPIERTQREIEGEPSDQAASHVLTFAGKLMLIGGGGGFAVWKARYVFDMTGRHRY